MNQASLAAEQGRAALAMEPGNVDAQRMLDAIQNRAK